jgi:antitoxin component YwqK of YwqJK toxin-antitoxin module
MAGLKRVQRSFAAYQEGLAAIPAEAEERVIERHADGSKKSAEYLLHGDLVGRRLFSEAGALELEIAMRNGVSHGPMSEWDGSGHLEFTTAYVDGKEHGTARQWANDGTLLGTYEMNHGTGLDLWWDEREDGSQYLSEARYLLAGDRDGYEWWLDEDQQSVWQERHFHHGQEHGIFRRWNAEGRLSRGYPQYFINGRKVNKRQYLRAAQADASLPPFRADDNKPVRQFPPDVAAALQLARK